MLRHPQHPAEIQGHVEVVVDEALVLRRVEHLPLHIGQGRGISTYREGKKRPKGRREGWTHLEHRRRRVGARVAAELVDLVEDDHLPLHNGQGV